jgi:hypothetical protein
MAVIYSQFVGSATSSSSATVTLTLAVNTTANNTLIIAAKSGNAKYATSAADSKGNTYTLDVYNDPTGYSGVSIFHAHLTAPLFIGTTITVTYNASASFGNAFAVMEFANVLYPSPLDATAVNNASATSISKTCAPSVSKDLFITVFSGVSSYLKTATVSTTWTRVWKATSNDLGAAAYKIANGSSAQTVVWTTTTSSSLNMAIACYKTATTTKNTDFFSVIG